MLRNVYIDNSVGYILLKNLLEQEGFDIKCRKKYIEEDIYIIRIGIKNKSCEKKLSSLIDIVTGYIEYLVVEDIKETSRTVKHRYKLIDKSKKDVVNVEVNYAMTGVILGGSYKKIGLRRFYDYTKPIDDIVLKLYEYVKGGMLCEEKVLCG